MSHAPDDGPLLARAAAGEAAAWADLLSTHRPRLRRIIAVRLDPRLGGVVDPSDVIQETFAELPARLPDYLRSPALPFFVWLRCLAGDKLARMHRHHLGVQARDANRTVHAGRATMPNASSVVLTGFLLDNGPAALDRLIADERRARVADTLDTMDPDDREVLVLRHFEELTAGEAGAVLGITEGAARKRYLRALERFTSALRGMPGGLSGIVS